MLDSGAQGGRIENEEQALVSIGQCIRLHRRASQGRCRNQRRAAQLLVATTAVRLWLFARCGSDGTHAGEVSQPQCFAFFPFTGANTVKRAA